MTERLARRGFYIPSGMALTDPQMEEVAVALKELMKVEQMRDELMR